MKQIVLGCTALLAMIVTPAQGQSMDAGKLQGCWQMDEQVITKLGGETVRRKQDDRCRTWIGEEKIFSVCKDPLGLVRHISENPYEMPSPDKLLFKGHRTPEDIAFEQDRLRRTTTDSVAKATERVPNPEVRRARYFTRVSWDFDNCLPKAEQVAAKDAWSIWQGPELARTLRRGMIELELVMRLRDRDALSIPADVLRPEDRERAVNELWKTLDRATALGMTDWDNQAASLDEIWLEKGVCSDHRQTLFLASPAVRLWATGVVSETMALQRVASRFAAATSLFPEETSRLLQEPSARSRETEKALKNGIISELFLLPRLVVVALAERPEIARIFDATTDFVALRDLGKRNAEFSYKNSLHYTDVLRCPGQLAASTLKPERASFESAERAWKDGLNLLRTRISYAADPGANKKCTSPPANIDAASLSASNGDMRLVKTTAGAPLTENAWELFDISSRYARGCGLPRDMKLARQVLEFAATTKSRGKQALYALCRLAHWNRYGLGGPKNELRAAELEQQVVDKITKQGCYPGQPVDPANPWQVL